MIMRLTIMDLPRITKCKKVVLMQLLQKIILMQSLQEFQVLVILSLPAQLVQFHLQFRARARFLLNLLLPLVLLHRYL